MELRIKHWRKQRGLSQEELGAKAGFSKSQISRWEKNDRTPNVAQFQTIADALEIPVRTLFPLGKLVPVVGYVGAGHKVFSEDAYAKGEGIYKTQCPDELDPNVTVALEVKGDSMLPIQDGWIIFYSRRNNFGQIDVINKLCVVKTNDGDMFIKRVKPGYKVGTYNLISTNADQMENIKLEWAAPVTYIKPGQVSD